jgi:hypothetical protein
VASLPGGFLGALPGALRLRYNRAVGSADFRINAMVRQILVRHWIEVDSISANAINGVLYVRGYIQFRAAKRSLAGDITPEFLERLERELKLIRDLKKIRWQLENWDRDETGWIPQGEGIREIRPKGAEPRPGQPPPPQRDEARSTEF